MNGIDISSHNGNINYSMLKASGIKYVYIKATEGVGFKDSRYLEYANNIKAVGLNFGFYHFMSEKTDPTQQAIDFYNAIKNTGYNLIPVLDIETNNLGRNKTQISDRCLSFLNKFKELSKQDCIIYTGGYFGRDNLDERIKNKYKGWIAHYGVSKPMDTGFKIVGHQYSETARISGINGNVDADNFTSAIELNNKTTVNTNRTTNGYNYHLRDFQSAYNKSYNKNILVDGLWGVQSNNAVNSIILKNGSRNDLVGWVQIRIGKCTVDGIFGPVTKQAVMEYQKSHGLAVDGIVGPNTLKTILKQYGVVL